MNVRLRFSFVVLATAVAVAVPGDVPVSAQMDRGIGDTDTVVVYPIFTQAAYGAGGFYDYYRCAAKSKDCDSRHLTVPIPKIRSLNYVASGDGFQAVSSLGYSIITDVDVDQNPAILARYKTVILLHNEYVTPAEFKAVTSHPKVVYLYPNALYAEIRADYKANQMTLVRGHQYPDSSIANGFGWKFDNTHPFEYDTGCEKWEFSRISNGWMLNCYPELVIANNSPILTALQSIVKRGHPLNSIKPNKPKRGA